MYTSVTNGLYNLFDSRGCLVRRGTIQEVMDAMKEMW
jgi:hypothetical protein